MYVRYNIKRQFRGIGGRLGVAILRYMLPYMVVLEKRIKHDKLNVKIL